MVANGLTLKKFICALLLLLALSTEAGATAQPTPAQVATFLETTGMAGLSQNAKVVLMQNLTADDIFGYLNFMNTDLGKRYLDFNIQASAICSSGMKAVLDKQISTATPLTLTPEQTQNYQNMLMASSTFQTLQYLHAHDKTDDGVIGSIMLTASLKQSPQQLGSLYAKYSGNIDAFNTYNKTQTAQNLMAATLKAAEQNMKDNTAH